MVTTRDLKSQGLTMSSYVMINGKISPEKDASIPAQDRGFLFGDCVYEIIAMKDGIPLDFERHLARLRRAAESVRISIPWSNQEILFDIEAMREIEAFPFAKLRLVITRGVGGGLLPQGESKTQKYLYYEEAVFPSYDETYPGAKLKTRRNPNPNVSEPIKSNNYLQAISSSLLASEEGYDEILWMGTDGELTESAFANAFFISREGDLVEIATAPESSGVLAGITRARIIELLTLAKIPVTIRNVTIEELPRFDEAFLTSSIRFLRPVSLIDRHRLHTLRKNSVYWQINRLYTAWVKGQTQEYFLQHKEDLKN